MDAFIQGYKVTLRRRHRQVAFLCSNHSEYKKIRHSLSSPAVMGMPENHLMWICTSLES